MFQHAYAILKIGHNQAHMEPGFIYVFCRFLEENLWETLGKSSGMDLKCGNRAKRTTLLIPAQG